MGILDKAQPIKETEPWIKFLLYGTQGAGKTYLAAQAPDPFFIDLERSTETLRSVPEFADIPILRPTKMSDIFDVCKEFPASQYQTLVIDTCTRLQYFQLKEAMAAAVRKNSSRNIYLPLFQEYRESSEMLDDIFMQLQNMEKHVILICHETEDWEGTDTDRRHVRTRPDLTPAVGKRLNGLLNVTGYLEYKPGIGTNPAKRILTVNPSGKIVAKNRLGIQQTTIENPTLETLFTRSFNNG